MARSVLRGCSAIMAKSLLDNLLSFLEQLVQPDGFRRIDKRQREFADQGFQLLELWGVTYYRVPTMGDVVDTPRVIWLFFQWFSFRFSSRRHDRREPPLLDQATRGWHGFLMIYGSLICNGILTISGFFLHSLSYPLKVYRTSLRPLLRDRRFRVRPLRLR